MSVEISRLVWVIALPATQKLVALRLADFADKDGTRIFPSVGTVAAECGLSERATRQAIRALEDTKILERVAYEDSGRHRPREYRLIPTKLVDMPQAKAGGTTCRAAPDSGRNVVPFRGAADSGEGGSTCPRTIIEPSLNHQYPRKRHAKAVDQEPPVGFDDFWAAYPERKGGKFDAETAYRRALKVASPEALLAGARRHAVARQGEDPQFNKHASTWLNKRCWLDEEPAAGSAAPERRSTPRKAGLTI